MMKNILRILTLSAAMAPAGAVADDVIARYDMTLDHGRVIEAVSGTAYTVQTGSLAPFNVDGARGKALRLDGYSNFIEARLPAQTLTQMTLSVWCAAETYPMMNTAEAENTVTYTTLAGNLDEAAKKGFNIMLSSQGDLMVRFCSGGWGPYEMKATKKMPRTQWNNIVLTLDAKKKLTLYNNGEQLAQSNTMGSIDLGTAPFMIGKSAAELKSGPFHINTFCGLIDDIELSATSVVPTAATAEHEPDFRYPASRYEGDALAALWRPTFHGMPSGAWTNETHGMAYSGGRYHLFFQKNANGPYMARLHWGHISSENLYDWREEDIAFGPGETYDIKGCWSGCLYQHPSLNDGKLTAYYTAVDNGRATICQATADDDDLQSWSKPAKNPLVNGRPGGLSDDFRDCYLFNAGGSNYMIVGTSKNNIGACTLHRLNGASWTNDGSIFFQGASKATAGRFIEMPNVTRMGDRYLFTATPLETSAGVQTLYWVGDINADGTFAPVTPLATPGHTDLEGFSRDGYGMLSPTILQHDGKTIALGIVPDKLPTQYNAQMGWAHNYSLPREWTLQGATLVQRPYSGLAAMRTATRFSLAGTQIDGSQPLGEVGGRAIEVEAEFTVGSGAEFGITLLGDGTKGARLSYAPATATLTLDLTGVERVANDDASFKGVYRSTLPEPVKAGETLRLHVFLDHSILDIFVNNRHAASVRVFPTNATADRAEVFSVGATLVKALNAWTLDPSQSADAIQAPSQAASSQSPVYDLSGRPAPAPRRGLYISQGRKCVVRE